MANKLLIVAPYFYPKIGGMENYSLNIARGLNKKYGWDIAVITSNDISKKYECIFFDGIKIYKLPRWFKISNTQINPLWYFQIKKIIKDEKPDIINAHTPVPFISDMAGLVRGKIPFVLTYHGDLIKSGLFLKLMVRLYSLIIGGSTLKKSNAVIAASLYYAETSVYLRNYLAKIFIISPGVDLPGSESVSVVKTNDILYVGRIEKNSDLKGIRYLLEAISIIKNIIPDVSLRLVGIGDRVDYFKKYSDILKISDNVQFVGLKTGSDLAKEYQKSKVLVLPSINAESFGMVLIEAMAYKLPVIGSNIGGIPYVIKDGENGFLVQPRNADFLGKKILEILQNENLATVLGTKGYMDVLKNFTWDKKIERTNYLFCRLVAKAKAKKTQSK
jgi:glycosyltransferase involved in cell wall biosynthesis